MNTPDRDIKQTALDVIEKEQFAIGGLLVIVVLGGVLWQFQDSWLSYWWPHAHEALPGDVSTAEPVEPPSPASAPNTRSPRWSAR